MDAEVLRLYALPARCEAHLLRQFSDVREGVPGDFRGYYPDRSKAVMSLRVYLSKTYQRFRRDGKVERPPAVEREFEELAEKRASGTKLSPAERRRLVELRAEVGGRDYALRTPDTSQVDAIRARQQRTRESIADAFVFVAVMIYAAPPANAPGPAVLLAALAGFASSYGITRNRQVVLKVGMAVISTTIAASFYGVLVDFFDGDGAAVADGSLPLDTFLLPVLVLAGLQYVMSTVVTSWFLSFEAGGDLLLIPSQETIVWTLTTKLAGAASAVLFYAAIMRKGVAYAVLGLLLSALVHFLYRFNERFDELVILLTSNARVSPT
jgi:hypothetical protein